MKVVSYKKRLRNINIKKYLYTLLLHRPPIPPANHRMKNYILLLFISFFRQWETFSLSLP